MKGLDFCMSQRDFSLVCCSYQHICTSLELIQIEELPHLVMLYTALPEHHVMNRLVLWFTWTHLL